MPYFYRCELCNDEEDIWGAFELNKEASCEACGQECCRAFCLTVATDGALVCNECIDDYQEGLDKQDEDKDNG